MSAKIFKTAVILYLIFGTFLIAAQEILLSDDFQSNKNGWYENDAVQVHNGRYEFSNKTRAEYTWMNDTMEDGSLEADTSWLGDETTRGYGLVFRLVDAKNFYFLWITGEGNYTVGKVVDDRAVPIKGWTFSEVINKRGENHLRVEFCGPLMNIFINGEKVSVLKDDTFNRGGYGFYTHAGVHAGYDNVNVVSGSPFQLHMPSNGSMESFRDMTGKTFSLILTGSRSGKIWGTDVYTDDSNIAAAAVHADVLDDGETGTILITMLPGQESYSGSERNGVTSNDFGSWHGSYRVERLK
jgi:hypothetical protein